MTFDAFLATITGSAPGDWVRLPGAHSGALLFVLRSDIATTMEYGGAARLDPAHHGGLKGRDERIPLWRLDCLREGRVVYTDVLALASTGTGVLPLRHNAQGLVGTARRDLARLIHRLLGHAADFDQLWQAAGLQVAVNDPLA